MPTCLMRVDSVYRMPPLKNNPHSSLSENWLGLFYIKVQPFSIKLLMQATYKVGFVHLAKRRN